MVDYALQWSFWSHSAPARVDHAPAMELLDHSAPARVHHASTMELLEPQRFSYGGPRSSNGTSKGAALRRWMTSLR
ncbi:hypothetical protein AMTR_s00093p00106180 [Amborella trichopoda]|uniref:Uncharacterized protein n=1 Tax=Amborella trichopoda TaxID=13333 RepID=W1NSV6_AMBTC|nr:hypothetical protein AMTR_s00093p00106180 [Amborella trichopoda]